MPLDLLTMRAGDTKSRSQCHNEIGSSQYCCELAGRRSAARRRPSTIGNVNGLLCPNLVPSYVSRSPDRPRHHRCQSPLGDLYSLSGIGPGFQQCNPLTGSLKQLLTTNPSVPICLYSDPIPVFQTIMLPFMQVLADGKTKSVKEVSNDFFDEDNG